MRGVVMGGYGQHQAQAAPAEPYHDVGCYDYPVGDGRHQYCYDFSGVSVRQQTPSGNASYIDNGAGRITILADGTVVEEITGSTTSRCSSSRGNGTSSGTSTER
jgi:hypothetical protein